MIGKFLKALFSEKSDVSMMRVMSILSLLIGGYIAVHGLDTKSDLSGVAMLTGVFIGAAFGGKVMQKSVEIKSQMGQTSSVEQKSQPPES